MRRGLDATVRKRTKRCGLRKEVAFVVGQHTPQRRICARWCLDWHGTLRGALSCNRRLRLELCVSRCNCGRRVAGAVCTAIGRRARRFIGSRERTDVRVKRITNAVDAHNRRESNWESESRVDQISSAARSIDLVTWNTEALASYRRFASARFAISIVVSIFG